MIFAHTIANVLNGKKSQTRRLCYAHDQLFDADHHPNLAPGGKFGVYESTGNRWRWIIGHTYAVQRQRCHRAEGRIRITGLRREENPLEISESDAIAEGFESAEAFRAAWKSLHKKNPVQAVWVIEFELVKKAVAAGGGR